MSLFTPSLTTHAVEMTERTTPTGIPLSEVGSRVDDLIANHMHEFTPGTAVVVVKDGEIIFSRGYGYADIDRHIPVDPGSTVLEFGSINKLFVYVSVMQLVEQGLLDLDADIHIYLPEDLSRQLNFEKSFTMRDLLNHSAGFGEFLFYTFMNAETLESEFTLREGLLMMQPRQIFEPGTASSYSNFGSALAAYVVSYISGQDFVAYERENILDILGMTNTKNQPDWFNSLNNNEFVQSKARGHLPDGNGGFIQAPWVYVPIYPAGSIRGTAEDLAQFAKALTPAEGENSPLFNSRDTLDLMLSPSYFNPSVMRGMLHGFISYDGIYPSIGHSGGTAGFNAEFAIVPSERFGVVILSNANGALIFNDKVLDLLIGNSQNTLAPPADNLPDARVVAGNFVMLRRHEGNVFEPINFLIGSNIRVEAIDESTISVNALGVTVIYQQVEPYVFRAISSGAILSRAGYELYFRMENGSPVGISMSAPFDATIETFSQSITSLAVNAIIAGISILFFLIMPIIILIGFLRKKDKKTSHFNHLSNGLLLSGTLLTINNILLILGMFGPLSVMIMPTTTFVMSHVRINYIILAIAAILLIASILRWKKDEIENKRKAFYFSTIVFMALLSFVFWNWNLFVIM